MANCAGFFKGGRRGCQGGRGKIISKHKRRVGGQITKPFICILIASIGKYSSLAFATTNYLLGRLIKKT